MTDVEPFSSILSIELISKTVICNTLSGYQTKTSDLWFMINDLITQIVLSMEVMKEMGISFGEMLACGGGGSSPLWRQMLADVTIHLVQKNKRCVPSRLCQLPPWKYVCILLQKNQW